MKRDMELARQILERIEDCPEPTDFVSLARPNRTADEIFYNLQLLGHARRVELSGNWSILRVSAILPLTSDALKRLSPPGSVYLDRMDVILNTTQRALTTLYKEEDIEMRLRAVLAALRTDYEADRLQTFQEFVHAHLFSDFLEMAEYFLDESHKDPAAVIARSVLDAHLRNL